MNVAALVALIVSVAALDSLNPSTVAPALVLAVGGRPRRNVATFTAGVFGVSTAGGLVLLFGAGHGLLAAISKPSHHTQHLVEATAGGALLLAAVVLWFLRGRIGRRLADPTAHRRARGSAFVLGAGIMAVELPTAFPYFAGLVAVVESRAAVATEIALVLLYNLVFAAPLVAVLALVVVGGESAERYARTARRLLDEHAPTLVPLLLGAIGIVLLAVGGSRL